LKFLKEIDAQVPEGLDVHIVMDNYATHKTPKIKAWLTRRPHNHVHFTPTSASWINQVERWFAELTRKQIQRGVHTSVRQLEADIRTFIDLHNRNPKPFKWTKSADQILASVKRSCHSPADFMWRTLDSRDWGFPRKLDRNLSKIEQRRRTGCDRLVAERRGPLPRRFP
jgi:transposase